MNREEALLNVQNVSFSYEDKKVLNNVCATIHRGDKIAVMGSNGAGKSTFFLQLNGVLQPDEGEIFLSGKRISKKEVKELCKHVGFVFQDADHQLIGATVKAEISFGPINLGLSRDTVKKRVEETIEDMELKELEERPPHELSGGEKKRVCIADILAMEPEVLLFDEPMAALDPLNAEKVETILERLHKAGKTILVATHDVEFAYRFADRILVFSEGNMIADGTASTIFNNASILQAAHLKKPAMMVVWETLLTQHIVKKQDAYPVTPQALEALLIHTRERTEE